MNWFKVAIAAGAFEEQTIEGTDKLSASAKTLRMQVTQKAPQKTPTRRERVPQVAALATGASDSDKKLIDATSRGQKAVVHRLLEEGAHVNARNKFGWTVLHLAARSGNEE
ncbi:hypothetical protein GP486_005831, partial [Trichoglossum hirsutum]